MIEILFLTIAIFYSCIIMFFYVGIVRELKRPQPPKQETPSVSVLVPARNESEHILATVESLHRQNYPANLLEIIIIDDHSTDGTGELVKQFLKDRSIENIQVLRHENNGEKRTYKKNAIAFALGFARGEIILTTDADCQVQPDWVTAIVNAYHPETGMVAGLITFNPESERTLFHKLQTLEFAGLVFAGVGAIGNHYPLICNGSNLSYRRAAFDEVGGFSGHDHIPSGDDDLFMQNLHHHTNWHIRYNLAANSINYTEPVDTLKQFLNQRARWASKSTHYPGILTMFLLLWIYLFYLMLLVLPPITVLGFFSWKIFLAGLALKVIPEFLVIRQALKILNRIELTRYFLIVEICQIPYIVFAGFAGFFNLYQWKQKE